MSVKQKPARRSAPAPKKPATKASKAAKAKPTPKVEPAPAKRQRIDWQAIQADHNTGKYTDTQLAAKHGTSRETISRQRKRDQAADARSWQKDLSSQVRQATNALLLRDQVLAEQSEVTDQITEGHAASAIVTAAEISKRVIVGHRRDIKEAADLAMAMLGELKLATHRAEELEEAWAKLSGADQEENPAIKRALMQRFNDFIRVHARVGSVHKLADTLAKLQTLERRAFNLDEPGEKPKDPPPSLADVVPGSEIDVYRAWVNG